MSETAKTALLFLLWVAVITVVLFLMGCVPTAQIKDQAAGVADGVLEGGLYSVCTATSVGALIRRYGRDPDGKAAWELMCSHEWSRNTGDIDLPEIGGGK